MTSLPPGVLHKSLLDRYWRHRTGMARPSFCDTENHHSTDPLQYLMHHFGMISHTSTREYSGHISLDSVLGDSWKWTITHVPELKRKELADRLTSNALQDPNHLERCQLIEVPATGFFIAHEGKNRIDFLRRMRCKSIPAFVQVRDLEQTPLVCKPKGL
jgi:hypothetical protein